MCSYKRNTKIKIKTILYPYYSKYYKVFSKNSYPDFLIIGALKSGTTSLYQYLINHSEIVSSDIKETNYFSWQYGKGVKYYLRHFPLKGNLNGRRVFEACPHYLADPAASKRISQILPKVKMIAILRDPIDRAVSNYNYFSNPTSYFGIRNPQDLDKRTVKQAFRDDIQGKESRIFRQYCRLSLYAEQLIRFYKYFKKYNILVLDFDELIHQPKATLVKVSDFLNISHLEFESFEDSKESIPSEVSFQKNYQKSFHTYNKQDYNIDIDEKLEHELIDFYAKDVKKLIRLTGTSFRWDSKYISNC